MTTPTATQHLEGLVAILNDLLASQPPTLRQIIGLQTQAHIKTIAEDLEAGQAALAAQRAQD